MEAEALIVFHQEYNPLTQSTYLARVEWLGDPSALVRIDRHTMERYRHQFPWKLELVKKPAPWEWGALYCRTDLPVPIYSYRRFENDVLAIVNFLKGVGHRLVLTAMVWGLAYVAPGEIPGWWCLGRKWG